MQHALCTPYPSRTAHTTHDVQRVLSFSPNDRTLAVVLRRTIVYRSGEGIQERGAFLYDFPCALASPMLVDTPAVLVAQISLCFDARTHVTSAWMQVRQCARGVGRPERLK